MSTAHEDGWVLIKPDDYLAIPVSMFSAIMAVAKNVKSEWSGSKTLRNLSNEPMAMLAMTNDQMTTMMVRSRLLEEPNEVK